MILPAQTIRALCFLMDDESVCRTPMIVPFAERTVFNGVSYGLSAASYDIRIDRDIELWPGRSVRADAMERICMPDDVMGLLFSKSTWARLHIEHAGTVIDPGFEGVLRLEINMHDGSGVQRIAAGTGIAQIVFLRLEAPTAEPYIGKYSQQGCDQDAIFSGLSR